MQTFACRKFVWRRISAFLPLVTSLRTGLEICIDMLELLSSVFSPFPRSEINGKVYVSPRANQSPISRILWKLVQYVTACYCKPMFPDCNHAKSYVGPIMFHQPLPPMAMGRPAAWTLLSSTPPLICTWSAVWPVDQILAVDKITDNTPADRKPWPWIVQSYSYSTVSDLSTSRAPRLHQVKVSHDHCLNWHGFFDFACRHGDKPLHFQK